MAREQAGEIAKFKANYSGGAFIASKEIKLFPRIGAARTSVEGVL